MSFRDILEEALAFALACLVWVVGAIVLSFDWIYERMTNHE